jgi:hypothetical protein
MGSVSELPMLRFRATVGDIEMRSDLRRHSRIVIRGNGYIDLDAAGDVLIDGILSPPIQGR